MGAAADEPVEDWERFRVYLRLLADSDLDDWLRGLIDLSGVVQQTMLDAHLSRGQCRATEDGAKLAWLRRILLRNLLDEIRRVRRKNADLTLERSLEQSSARLAAELAAGDTSPSAHAARAERICRLLGALEQLPADQRDAVVRHHLEGASLVVVAGEMGKSREAVAGLLHRGLIQLRKLLKDEPT